MLHAALLRSSVLTTMIAKLTFYNFEVKTLNSVHSLFRSAAPSLSLFVIFYKVLWGVGLL